jgi:hypothetical protein
MTISVLHIAEDATEVRQYVIDNVDNISAIRISANYLLKELTNLGIINNDDVDNSLIVLRKITNRLFNNTFTRNRMPISTPEFICSFTEEALLDNESTSFLKICYHYSIPVFIDDAGVLNNIFASDICTNRPMLSSEQDWTIYNGMIDEDSLHFVYGLPRESSVTNLKLFAGMDIGFPWYRKIDDKESILDCLDVMDDMEIENYIYDKLF